jgi:voltage-gated potassium channel
MKTNSASSAPHSPLAWIGLAGVAPDENPRAQALQQRLHWWMVAFALLSLPAYFIDSIEPTGEWHRFAMLIDGFILLAFLAEAVWMSTVTSFPLRYLAENWLNLVVMIGAAAALFGATTEWVALIRIARVAIGGMMLVRAVAQFRYLFTRRGAPALVGVTFLTLLAAGGMFYWLDPRITNFWDGLWLAFVSGTTVGYGDVVPTTGPARLVAVFVILMGFALLSLFTASIVAFFVGADQTQARALHREVTELRRDLAQLVDAEEVRFRDDLHRDIEALRAEIARLVDTQVLATRRQLEDELRQLRADVEVLRAALARRDAPGAKDPE